MRDIHPLSGDHSGWIEVICGGMFSGKSEELIRRIRRAKIARQKVAAFKPAIDDRYHQEAIASHNGLMADARPVKSASEIPGLLEENVDVVAIDEIQFLNPKSSIFASSWPIRENG